MKTIKLLKNLLLSVLLLALLVSCVSQPKELQEQAETTEFALPQLTKDEVSQIIASAVNEIGTLIQKYGKDKNMRTVWSTVTSALKKGRLTFTIDLESNSILDGALFIVTTDGQPRIQLSNGLITLYRYQPTVLMSVLLHELTHAYFYLTMGEEFISASNDRKERNWYEADAIHNEAVFIEQCLAPYYKLSSFEQFVLESWHSDNIDSASIVMVRESSETILVFHRLTQTYIQGAITAEEAYAEIEEYTSSILEIYNDKTSSHAVWALKIIALNSCYYYYNRFLADIIERDPALVLDTYLEAEPVVTSMYETIKDIIANNIDKAHQIIDRVIASWEQELQTIILEQLQAA